MNTQNIGRNCDFMYLRAEVGYYVYKILVKNKKSTKKEVFFFRYKRKRIRDTHQEYGF